MSWARGTWNGAPRWAWVVIVVGAIAGIVLLPIAVSRTAASTVPAATAPTTSAAAPTVEAKPFRVLVIGDQYATGSVQGGIGPTGWPQLVTDDLRAAGYDIEMRVAAADGSGYVSTGPSGVTYTQLAQRAAGQDFDLVVFFGSNNDRGPRATIRAAADEALAVVRLAAPDAALLVIGPAWPDDSPPAAVVTDRDAIAQAAAEVEAVFVDPLGEGWFVDRPELIGDDGVNPTDDGHRYLADLIRPRIEEQLTLKGAVVSPTS